MKARATFNIKDRRFSVFYSIIIFLFHFKDFKIYILEYLQRNTSRGILQCNNSNHNNDKTESAYISKITTYTTHSNKYYF